MYLPMPGPDGHSSKYKPQPVLLNFSDHMVTDQATGAPHTET